MKAFVITMVVILLVSFGINISRENSEASDFYAAVTCAALSAWGIYCLISQQG